MPLHFMTVNYLVELAKSDEGKEVCGLILANEEVHPILNVAREPARRFEMDPHQQLKAIESASVEKMGDQIIGMFHSHVSGNPVPSEMDLDHWAPEGWKYWIVAGDYVVEWERHGSELREVSAQKAEFSRQLAPAPTRGPGGI